MPWITIIIAAFVALCAVLALMLALRPGLTSTKAGKILAFVALFILPVMAASMGVSEHMERAKETRFCLSCHIMEPYGRSLYVDDKEHLAAAHFQNHRVPADEACYTCHTDYSIFGPIKAKLGGLRHIYIQYLGKPPKPEEIKLYKPYNNRECLHCHDGARSFEQQKMHSSDPNTMSDIKSNKLSCTDAGCHDVVHNVGELGGAKMWSPAK